MSWAEAVDGLSQDPRALAELAARRAAIVARGRPASPAEIIAALAPLVSLYGAPRRSEAEWTHFWGFYTRALAGLPFEALEAGVADYVAAPTSDFFPRPGPLRAMIQARAAPLRMAANRAERALATAQTLKAGRAQ